MDIGIDTIVYIVLGLVFVLAQATRKKKAAQQAQVKDNEEFEEFEEEVDTPQPSLLQEFYGQNPDRNLAENRIETVSAPTEITPLSSAKSIHYESDENDMIKKGQMSVKNDLTNANNLEEISKKKSKLKFDLRKAVIYSAILERKYF